MKSKRLAVRVSEETYKKLKVRVGDGSISEFLREIAEVALEEKYKCMGTKQCASLTFLWVRDRKDRILLPANTNVDGVYFSRMTKQNWACAKQIGSLYHENEYTQEVLPYVFRNNGFKEGLFSIYMLYFCKKFNTKFRIGI